LSSAAARNRGKLPHPLVAVSHVDGDLGVTKVPLRVRTLLIADERYLRMSGAGHGAKRTKNVRLQLLEARRSGTTLLAAFEEQERATAVNREAAFCSGVGPT
jgi:hypothetical protein